MYIRTEVRGDFYIHGTKYFYDRKFRKYDVVSSYTFGGPKKRTLYEILTLLVTCVFSKKPAVSIFHVEHRVFWQTYTGGLQHHFFKF